MLTSEGAEDYLCLFLNEPREKFFQGVLFKALTDHLGGGSRVGSFDPY
jgi:hypothetical protein